MFGNFVVSRNYRDRESPKKWLVRRIEESPEQAIAYERVLAIGGVIFCPASQLENERGCSKVGQAAAVQFDDGTGVDPELPGTKKTPVHFYCGSFVDEQYNTLKKVYSLLLNSDGSMLATLAD